MSGFKLTYFDVRARAEPIRYLFALAGQEYEDCRVGGPTWQALKPSESFTDKPDFKSFLNENIDIYLKSSWNKLIIVLFGH